MNTASIRFTRAYVPGFGLDREPVAIRTCARLRWRAHSDITLTGLNRTRTPPAPQSVATYPPGNGNWDRTIERTNSLVALARSLFTRRGHIGILNSCWPFKASSSLSLSFVHDANQPTNGISNRFLFPPIPFVAAAHVEQHEPKGLLNGTKSEARPGKSTARNGNYAC